MQGQLQAQLGLEQEQEHEQEQEQGQEQEQEQEQEQGQVDEQHRWLQRCTAPNPREDGVFQHLSPEAAGTTAGLSTQ